MLLSNAQARAMARWSSGLRAWSLGVQPGVALGSGGRGGVVAFGGGAEEHLASVVRVGGADRVAGGGEPVHALVQ